MSDARSEILARIRAAVPAPATIDVPRAYNGAGQVAVADRVALFAERVLDYRAAVRHCAPEEVAATIGTCLAERAAVRVVIPPGFPAAWLPSSAVIDDPLLEIAELDALDGVVTTCAAGIAVTGTIVLDGGPGQGRRAVTLVPDYHLVVVAADQIVAAVPDAIAALDPLRPLTWISGPSATSDIELNRIEGVHGPRTLEVLIAG